MRRVTAPDHPFNSLAAIEESCTGRVRVFEPPQFRARKPKKKREPKFTLVPFFQRVPGAEPPATLVPRFCAFGSAYDPSSSIPRLGPRRHLSVNFQLQELPGRPQQSVRSEAAALLERTGGCVILLHPGSGKTNVAIHLAAEMGLLPCAVLCNTKFLLAQWRGRIEATVPGARIGLVQGDTVDTDDRDFILISMQSLLKRRYQGLPALQLLVVDECHHIPAMWFSTSLPMLDFRYSLGLTATPKRSDGLGKFVFQMLGPSTAPRPPPMNPNVQVTCVQFRADKCVAPSDADHAARLVSTLSVCAQRNQLLAAVTGLMARKPGRKGLVLTHREQHAVALEALVSSSSSSSSEPVVSTRVLTGMRDSSSANGKRTAGEPDFTDTVTFSTAQLFSEAIDFDGCFLIMATPSASVEQACGRVLRGHGAGARPVIIDVVDTNAGAMAARWAKSRARLYAQRGWTVITVQSPSILLAAVAQ